MEAIDLNAVFKALGHETRRSILEQLQHGERTVLELAQPHDVSLNAVSKHLKQLENAGLIRRTVDGSYHHLALEPEQLKAAFQWMSRYAPFWDNSLQSLKRYVEGH